MNEWDNINIPKLLVTWETTRVIALGAFLISIADGGLLVIVLLRMTHG